MTKIACSSCGVSIQATTGERTGGKCMVCHQGIICPKYGERSMHRVGNLYFKCHTKENPPPHSLRKFDHNKILTFSIEAIDKFVKEHQDETF